MTIASEQPVEAQRPGHIVVRTALFDLRFHWKVLTLVLFALGIAVLVGVWAMALGAVDISPWEVFLATFGQGTDEQVFVVQELRLPRVLVALMVGAALAMSGAIFQGLVRNELASPDIIGINTGAAAVGFTWLLVTRNPTGLPFVLFFGAMGVAALIYLMSWKGGISTNRLILVGIGLQALLTALDSFLVRRFPMEDVIWAEDLLLGSVALATWNEASVIGLGLIVLVPAALFLAWPLRALQLGDDTARTVGIPVELVRFVLMVLGCWLCAIAIAVSGLIGFVALMIPHVARMIAGPISASVMLLTGVLGGFFLLASDIITHHFLPVGLPLSVVVGAVGAPYFLFLFWRSGVRM